MNLKTNNIFYHITMKLLVHITYYSNETRVDKIKKRPSNLFDKDSQQWRDHVYKGVLKVIFALRRCVVEAVEAVASLRRCVVEVVASLRSWECT